jgi:hypothetical protein
MQHCTACILWLLLLLLLLLLPPGVPMMGVRDAMHGIMV